MQKLYAQYADTVSNALKNGKKRGLQNRALSENFMGFNGKLEKSLLFSDQSIDETHFNSLQPLSAISGKKAKYHQRPGAHPDFSQIKEKGIAEYHYITSMFIDISRSTALFRRYEPIAVANITMTIQRAAMHTCWYFDAYIQRFHGDGLLVYFGGKSTTKAQSVQNAVNAASFFSYFMKNDLKNLFAEQGIEDIYTRIGIDMGEDQDVLWHLAGIGECSEITTCSLHTSLAAHMQGNAANNGIMVGDNVKDRSMLSPALYSIKKDKDGKEDRYIYRIPEENFNYTQWEFNWEKYLKNHPQVASGGFNLFPAAGAPAIIHGDKNMDYLKSQIQGYKPYYNGK